MPPLKAGHWLGVDLGSRRAKVCSFCLVTSDGVGGVELAFEKGPAAGPYPAKNTFDSLSDPGRAPTYLKREIEDAVGRVLADSELVKRWLASRDEAFPTAVAIDAPVALAIAGARSRVTEKASSDLFDSPDVATFETLLVSKSDEYLRINHFWKCVGFATYRRLARRLDPSLAEDVAQETLAAWTCSHPSPRWRIRETFPSDVYKRANGTLGTLTEPARDILDALVSSDCWRPIGTGKKLIRRPTFAPLLRFRTQVRDELESTLRLSAMRRHKGGQYGDLWDAFTCAFAVCCEDHGAGHFHGWDGHGEAPPRLRQEGAILTVARG